MKASAFYNKFIIALEKQRVSVLFELYQYAQNTHNNGPGVNLFLRNNVNAIFCFVFLNK